MATQNTTTVNVDVTDNGTTQKVIKDAKLLATELGKAQSVATKINTGGTAGSRKVAAMPSSGVSELTDQSYNKARGSAGITGASARDFAAQSQGLGGLVRLYATFAANVFAAGAAFRALSTAMDTTNMVRGLDQLGASVGKNLGALSKRIVEITDGSVSMREALQTVAQTSTGGISSKNIERLALVAKNASQTLGVAMPDAISRLSRGIVKLEPELLDELGLMTKIGPATETYARSVGKAVSQLTDLERRQAFANAVLTEGETKFGALGEVVANPYDKLLASLKNVLQVGLEFVNKFLGPVVSMLATNPTLLVTGIGLIASTLVKQALPALAQFKEGLQSASEFAKKAAEAKAADAKTAREALSKQIEAEIEKRAEFEISKVDQAEKRIQALQQGSLSKRSAAYKILQKASQDVTEQELKKVESTAKSFETKGLLEKAQAYRDVANAVRDSKQAEQDLVNAKVRNAALLDKESKSATSIFGLTQIAAAKAQEDSIKKNIIANAAYNGSLIGVTKTFKLLNAEIAASGLQLSFLGKATLLARAGLASFVGMLGTVAGALSSVLGPIGIIVSAVSLLDSVLSSNAKESGKFSTTLDSLSDSAASASRTLDQLDKKGGYAAGTIEGLTAISNALTDLADTSDQAVRSLIEVNKAAGFFERNIKNPIKSLFGADPESEIASTLTKSLQKALDLVEKAGKGPKAKQNLKDLLGIDSLDTKSLEVSIRSLSDEGKQNLVEKFIKPLNTEAAATAGRLGEFEAALDATKKGYDEFIQSTANTNPLFKLGNNIQSLSTSMDKLASQDIQEVDAALKKLIASPEKLIPLGKDITVAFLGIKDQLKTQLNILGAYDSAISNVSNEITKLAAEEKKAFDDLKASANQDMVVGIDVEFSESSLLQSKRKLKNDLEKGKLQVETKVVDEGRSFFIKSLDSAFKIGADLIATALGQAAATAGLTIAKAQAGILSGPRATAEQGRLSQQEISLQIRAIETSINLILSQEALAATINEATAQAALDSAIAEKKGVELAQATKNAATIYKNLITDKGLKKFTPDESASGTDAVTQKLVQRLVQGLQSKLSTQEASRTIKQGELSASKINTEREKKIGTAAERLQDAEATLKQSQAESSRLATLESIAGVVSGTLTVQNRATEELALQKKYTEELAQFDTKIAIAQEAASKAKGTEAQSAYVEEVARLKKLRDLTEKTQKSDTAQRLLQDNQKALAVEVDRLTKKYELTKAQQALADEIDSSALDRLTNELSVVTEVYGINERYATSMKNILETRKVELEYTKAIRDAQATLQAELDKQEARKSALGNDTAAIAAVDAEISRQRALTDATIAAAQVIRDSKLESLATSKLATDDQVRFNEALATTASLGESLTNVFGNVGTSIGAAASALVEFSINSEKGAKSLAEIDTKLKDSNLTIEQRTDLENARKTQITKNSKTELSAIANTASASKKMFNEKTAAYKLLNAAEKAAHLFSIALTLKEEAIKISSMFTVTAAKATTEATDTGIAAAGAAARGPFYAFDIFGKSVGQLGPIAGPIVGVALIAALFALLGGAGGGTSVGAAPSASVYQNEGKGTVLGDKDAQSESLSKALDRLVDVDVFMLRNSGNMLRHLRSIDEGINALSITILRSLGIRQDDAKAKYEGSITQNGFSGLASIPVVGKFLSNVLGGIFGKTKVTSSVVGQGITSGAQNLQNIVEGPGFQGAYFTDVRTEIKKKGLFSRSTKIQFNRYLDALQGEATLQFTRVFQGIYQSVLSATDALGEDLGSVKKRLNSYIVNLGDVNLTGLSDADKVAKLKAVFGREADLIAEAAVPGLKAFVKLGEGYSETLFRVGQAVETANVALEVIGVKAVKYTDILQKQGDVAAEIVRESLLQVETQEFIAEILSNMSGDAQTLIDTYKDLDKLRVSLVNFGIDQDFLTRKVVIAAGGFNELSDKVGNFFDKFGSSVTKTQINVNLVAKTFAQLGLKAVPKTREALFDLVKTLTTTAPEAAVKIMGITDALDSLYEPAVDVKDTLTSTVTQFKDFAKQIKDFRTQLLLGNQSILTPAEKYAQARQEFETTFSKALTGDKDAQSKLTQASSTFLDASKTLFASGDQYTSDFNSVLDRLGQAEVNALAMADVANLQLTALNGIGGILQNIDTNIASLTGGTSGIQAFAKGGYAKGLALVGENGPEIVDFNSPGRVYTADQTAGMFTGGNTVQAMQQVVAEVIELRKEVQKLREQQHEETGHLIGATYDAQAKNAEAVGDDIKSSSSTQAWTMKLQQAARIS